MILLIVDEDPDIVTHVLSILQKGGVHHEVHTASTLKTARAAANRMEHLDVLIAQAGKPNPGDASALCRDLRSRFAEMQCCYLDSAGSEPRTDGSPVFSIDM